MDRKGLAKKILQAREESGITQEAVEKALNLAQKAMSRIESGHREVSTLELSKLAALFHMEVADFFDESTLSEDALFVVLHRLVPGLEKNPKIRDQIARCLHMCREGVFLEKLLDITRRQSPIGYSYPCPKNVLEAIEQGEQAAIDERKRLGIGNFPIYDIVEILSSQGIWSLGTELPKELSGLFIHHPSIGMAIIVNAGHPQSRQRFSYAHEYAHALFDSKRTIVVSNRDNASELVEKRANAFAAAFLLSREGVLEKIKKFGKAVASRSHLAIFDVACEDVIEVESRERVSAHRLTSQDVALLAYHFGVSIQAIVYRLYSLRVVTLNEREQLLSNERVGKEYLEMLHLSKDLDEPGKKPTQLRELKAYISHLIIEAYRDEKISRGRLLELCKVLELNSKQVLDMLD